MNPKKILLNTANKALIIQSHHCCQVFFIGLLGVSLASTICMWICDCATSGYINMTIAEREKFDSER